MSKQAAEPENFKLGFFKTYVLPALLVFVIPVFSLWFFRAAEAKFDHEFREGLMEAIRAHPEVSNEMRQQAIERASTLRVSRELAKDPAKFRDMLSGEHHFYYATFRWMIRISWFSILTSVGAFLLGLLSVAFSLRSQRAQYISLSVGWHMLRAVCTLQVLLQGVLLVVLSFWVTALWFNFYSVRIILIAAVVALIADAAVISAIFKRLQSEHAERGVVINRTQSPALWQRLDQLCSEVGTAPPEHVIAGIDDNFFVTEHPMTVYDNQDQPQVVSGRTLYVSLSLLKNMQGDEADAVMLHEMAHFSGNDTVFAKKISPLLMRYHAYLEGLHSGGLSQAVFYFMFCFWSLFQISLRRLGRQREFRADGIAASHSSPESLVRALLKVSAYASYRGCVERELFEKESALQAANISERVAGGFAEYVDEFLEQQEVESIRTSHPFDTHPPFGERMRAVHVELSPTEVRNALLRPCNAQWYVDIDNAEQLERAQWDSYEEHFRTMHEQVLAYRYLPETSEEEELVQRYFPEVAFHGKKSETITFDCHQIVASTWEHPLPFHAITNCVVNDNVLTIHFERHGKRSCKIQLGKFSDSGGILAALNQYYGRFLAARQYQTGKRSGEGTPAEDSEQGDSKQEDLRQEDSSSDNP